MTRPAQALHRDMAALRHERDWMVHSNAQHLQQQEQHYKGEVHQLQAQCDQLQKQLQAGPTTQPRKPLATIQKASSTTQRLLSHVLQDPCSHDH